MNNPEVQSLKWILTLPDLSGGLTKTLAVPDGCQGVVLGGAGRIYPPGEHKVIKIGQRLFGKVSDWRFVLLPAAPFTLRVPVPRLQAGDGAWVDVDVLLSLRVVEPYRAAAGCPPTHTALATALSLALEPIVRQAVTGWSATDLGRSEVNARLAAPVRSVLDAQLESWGLGVERLLAVTALPSESAVAEARKLAEIEQALAQVDLDKKMAALTSQAEWVEFVRTLAADFDLPPATLERLLASAGEAQPDAAQFRQAVNAYAAGEAAALESRAQRLLGAPPQAPTLPIPAPWWEQLIPGFKFLAALLLFIGLALFAIAPLVQLPHASTLLLAAVLGAAILFVVALWLESRAAVLRRTPTTWRPLLERLGKGDRERIDQLVREQITRELQVLAEKLRGARNWAFQEGLRDIAPRLKEVEERADRTRQSLAAEKAGPAAYLTQAKISRRQLAAMLDYDETLLAHTAALGDRAEAVRQRALDKTLTLEEIQALDVALSGLDHHIQARARFIQAPTTE